MERLLPGWHASCCRTGAALTRLSTWHLTPLHQTAAISRQPALPYNSHWADHCFGLGAGTTLVRSSSTRFSQTWRWSHRASQRLPCSHVWERTGTCYHKNPAANGPATFLATQSNRSWASYVLNLSGVQKKWLTTSKVTTVSLCSCVLCFWMQMVKSRLQWPSNDRERNDGCPSCSTLSSWPWWSSTSHCFPRAQSPHGSRCRRFGHLPTSSHTSTQSGGWPARKL